MKSIFPKAVGYLAVMLIASLGCNQAPVEIDLGAELAGTYLGRLTLQAGSNQATDVEGQKIEITRLDNSRMLLRAITYPDSSPLDTLSIEADLTPTPFGFIQTEGAMLTFKPVSFSGGTLNGTPYSISGGGTKEAHGAYNRNTQELVFAVEILEGSEADYELFVGTKED
ncbi:MAG: hypothetical protein AAFR61_22350 [Bacteroidota bacterium]